MKPVIYESNLTLNGEDTSRKKAISEQMPAVSHELSAIRYEQSINNNIQALR